MNKGMNRRLSKIDPKPFVSSTVFYTKEEFEEFLALFSELDIIDYNLKTYVQILKELLANGNLDNLPPLPEERKKYIKNMVECKIQVIPKEIEKEKMSTWFNQACAMDTDLELSNELIDRYCWEEFVDRVQMTSNQSSSFRDKLTIKPISPNREKKKIKSLSEVEDIIEDDADKMIYQTGIEELDSFVKMKRSNLVVVAARTTVGKSLFMINQAIYNASQGKKILYVSLEESEQELKKRVESHIFDKKGEDRKKVLDNFIVFTPSTSSPDTVLNEIAKFVKAEDIGVVFIDYLQLMKYPGMNDFESLRALTREFKVFATSRNILLVTASQIKRDAEYTGANLTGLFGSSTIEADANIIIILEPSRRQQSARVKSIGSITISVQKNRSGAQGEVLDITIDYSNGHIYKELD